MSTISNNTDTWPKLSPEAELEIRAVDLLQRAQHLPVPDRRRILSAFQVSLDNLERSILDAAE